jgi:hypothetical protein
VSLWKRVGRSRLCSRGTEPHPRERVRKEVGRWGGGDHIARRGARPARGIGLSPFGQRAALCQWARGMARWKVAGAGWFEAFAGLWFPEIGGSVFYFASGGATSRATRGIAITCR